MATNPSGDRLTLTEYPFLLWIGGGASILFAFWLIFMEGETWFGSFALAIGLFLVLGLARVTTIGVDRPSERLTLRYWSPLFRSGSWPYLSRREGWSWRC